MKKILILLTVVTFCHIDQCLSQLSFGPIAGGNYCILTTNYESSADEPDPNDPAVGFGFHAGVVADYLAGDQIGVRTGLVFSSRGVAESFSSEFTFQDETTTTEIEYKSSYSYIEIPTFLTYTLGSTITVFAGPQFGILSGVKESIKTSVTNDDGTETSTTSISGSEAKEGLSSLDIDLVGGVQVNMENGLNLGLRYGQGFTPLNAKFTNVEKTTWGVLALTVGFTL